MASRRSATIEQQQSRPRNRARQVSASAPRTISATREIVAARSRVSSQSSGSRPITSQKVSQKRCSIGAAATTRPSRVGYNR